MALLEVPLKRVQEFAVQVWREWQAENLHSRKRRWWQEFCCTRCRQAFHNRRLYRRKAKGIPKRQGDAFNTHLSARRPWNGVIALFWRNGRFFNTERKLKSSRAVLKVRAEDGVVVSFRLLAQRREKSRDSGLGTRGSGRAAV